MAPVLGGHNDGLVLLVGKLPCRIAHVAIVVRRDGLDGQAHLFRDGLDCRGHTARRLLVAEYLTHVVDHAVHDGHGIGGKRRVDHGVDVDLAHVLQLDFAYVAVKVDAHALALPVAETPLDSLAQRVAGKSGDVHVAVYACVGGYVRDAVDV